MTLQPTVRLRLGRLEYATHTTRVAVTLGVLPVVGRADVAFPAGTRVDAEPGDEGVLTLDGGDGGQVVLTGSVLAVGHDVDAVTVRLADAGADLAAARPVATSEGRTPGEVIRSLCADAGVATGSLESGDALGAYVAAQDRTAAEHVARLAGLAGALAVVDARGRVTTAPRPTGRADVALRYGRELAEYAVSERGTPATRVAVGHGAGTPSAPDALRPTPEPLTGGAADPASDTVWLPHPVLRSPAGVRAASGGLQGTDVARTRRLRATCWLQPQLRPGMVVEVQDLPGRLDAGPWLLTGVRHVIDTRSGARTVLTAEVGGEAAGGLLARALSVIGGL